MAGTRARPFGMLDAMILAGAPALGLAIPRAVIPGDELAELWPNVRSAFAEAEDVTAVLQVVAWLWEMSGEPVLLALAGAVVVLRLRRPRPPLRRAFRSPGVLACTWIVLGVALVAASLLIVLGVTPVRDSGQLWLVLGIYAMMHGQLASAIGVLAVLWTAALYRRRACEPGWIDRLGLAVAAVWLLTAPIQIVMFATLALF